MLTKMIFKMLFKAMIPFVMIIGVISYGMYTRGGDPAAFFGNLAGNVGNPFQSVKNSVQGAGDSLQALSPVDMPSSKTTIYKWVDEYGNTQFGSTPPDGVNATSKTYNNNANTMAATPVQKPVAASTEQQAGFGPDGERLPGVAGMNLPTAVDPEVLSGFLQTMQQQQ